MYNNLAIYVPFKNVCPTVTGGTVTVAANLTRFSVLEYNSVSTVFRRSQADSTRSSRTTYCSRHNVLLTKETFEMSKSLLSFFSGKVERE